MAVQVLQMVSQPLQRSPRPRPRPQPAAASNSQQLAAGDGNAHASMRVLQASSMPASDLREDQPWVSRSMGEDSSEPSTSAPCASSVYAALTGTSSRNIAGSMTNRHTHPARLPGTSAAAVEGKRLAALIRGCSDWYHLRALIATNREALNLLHATSALSLMARLASYPMQAG